MPTMEIRLVEGRTDAHIRGFTVPIGGDDAPSPFEFFIASLGSCAALTVAGYCRSRQLDYEGAQILIEVERNADNRMADKIKMELVMPAGFPEEHHARLVKAADACFVKKHLYDQPEFETTVRA